MNRTKAQVICILTMILLFMLGVFLANPARSEMKMEVEVVSPRLTTGFREMTGFSEYRYNIVRTIDCTAGVIIYNGAFGVIAVPFNDLGLYEKNIRRICGDYPYEVVE